MGCGAITNAQFQEEEEERVLEMDGDEDCTKSRAKKLLKTEAAFGTQP